MKNIGPKTMAQLIRMKDHGDRWNTTASTGQRVRCVMFGLIRFDQRGGYVLTEEGEAVVNRERERLRRYGAELGLTESPTVDVRRNLQAIRREGER